MMTEEQAREMAAKIVSDIMVNDKGEPASRLVLMWGEKNLGEWSRSTLMDRITEHLSGTI